MAPASAAIAVASVARFRRALAPAPTAAQNGGMRSIQSMLLACAAATLALPPAPASARADSTTIYRCETPAGISLQSQPCRKGVQQTRLTIQRPIDAPPPDRVEPVIASPSPTAAPTAPLTATADIRGPNDPYPLWECMRADGSTFESRDGVPGRQWVVKPADSEASADTASTINGAPAQITVPAKGPILRPYVQTESTGDAPAVDLAPPPGAAAGQWVADQCVKLDPQQACDRYAVRRDALRKQIYAALPSERVKYAPEEQDLTSMLYTACQR